MARPMQFETAAAVERAMDLFWAQGYGATTPQQLASQMGIGKGSLYNTFESKHSLFVRALERYSEMRLQFLTELFAGPGAVKPRLMHVVVVLSGVDQHRRGCVMVNATAELGTMDGEVDRVAGALFDGIASIFERVIRSGRESRELTGEEPPEIAARQLLATVIGLSVLIRSGGRVDQCERIVEGVVLNL